MQMTEGKDEKHLEKKRERERKMGVRRKAHE